MTIALTVRPGIPDRNQVNAQWLLRLRWAQIAGQASTILAVKFLIGVDLPLAALSAVVLAGLLSNIACAATLRSVRGIHEWQLAAVMALDVTFLTVLLYYTGGPGNPFSFLYLVQIALATVILHAQWTWALVALSLGSFGVLLLAHRALPGESARYHHEGMWLALAVASAFIVHFLLRISAALGARERELTLARNLAERQERVASLATMAAGAAHELATPLGTIALVAKEIERAIERARDRDRVITETHIVEDARLIREQVGRCRVILDQMAGGAGESAGEGLEPVAPTALLDEALANVRGEPLVRLEVATEVAACTVRVPPRAVAQAMRSLITNAQDASLTAARVSFGAPAEVVVNATLGGGKAAMASRLRVEVRDRGLGMSREVMARLGEPFFTTKAPGQGRGLGMFLARAVVEGVGGTMTIDSRLGQGTTVVVTLPTDAEKPAPLQPDGRTGT